MASPWLAFYLGRAPDSEGRFLHDILAWTDDDLESIHDYIQWLFPLPEPSMFNPRAPLLTSAEIAAVHVDEIIRDNIRAAYLRMLRFYGLTPETEEKPKHWLRANDHNHLRLTRILRSLRLLGFPEEAQELYTAISRYNDAIPARTKEFWREAVQ